MAETATLLIGTGVGGTLAFLFDPRQGRRRRALVRDRAFRTLRRGRDAFEATIEDARNRARGVVAETRARLAEKEPPWDDVLAERARARLGLVASHPRALEVRAERGRVIVSGPALAPEAPRLVAALRRVRGVRDVEDRLECHDTADVPALQGPPARVLTSATASRAARAAATLAVAAFAATRARRYARTALAASLVGILGRALARP